MKPHFRSLPKFYLIINLALFATSPQVNAAEPLGKVTSASLTAASATSSPAAAASSSGVPSVAPQAEARPLRAGASSPYMKKVQDYLTQFESSPFYFQLTPSQISTSWSQAGFQSLYEAQVKKVTSIHQGPQDSMEKLNLLKVQEKQNAQALQLVQELFTLSTPEINLHLMFWLHSYIFNPQQRQGLQTLFEAIEIYKFSPEELLKIRQDSSRLEQYTSGSLTAFGVASLVAIAFNPKVWPTLWKKLTAFKSRAEALPETRAPIISSLDRGANESMTIDEALQILERLGIQTAQEASGQMSTKAQVAVNMSKMRLHRWAQSARRSYGFKSFAFVTGASVVGGATNIGWQALDRQLYPETLKTHFVNPKELRDQMYDGLAVAHLSCQSHHLRTQANTAQAADVEKIGKSLVKLFAEYSLLTTLLPEWTQPTTLPSYVKAEPGALVARLKVKDEWVNEKIPCLKMKQSASQVDVSLLEVLGDITEVYYQLLKLSQPAPEKGGTR